MRAPKIVFIGAGSMSFGLPTFRDIFTTKLLKGAQLWLVDINPDNLKRMHALALKMKEASGLELAIHATENRLDALPDADFIISSLAIERCELWRHDFNIPKKYGVRHTLGENGGPGALYFTMRTLPLVLDIARDMERLCPDAYFLNFSNPETRLVLGVNMYTKIKCVGLCHGIFMARDQIGDIIGYPHDRLDLLACGMNHFQWVQEILDTKTGEDLYPLLREKEKTFDPKFMPYCRKMMNAFGLYPSCSDDHLGEYQAYGYEAGEEGYNFDWDEQDRVRMRKEIEEVLCGKRDVKEWLHPSGERAVQLLTAVHFNIPTRIPSAIVYNDGAMPQLPPDVAVELPVLADGHGVHKTHPPRLPDGIVALLNNQVSPQRMSVRAAAAGSKELALQALLCDPVINSTAAAMGINDELFEINKPYIRKCV